MAERRIAFSIGVTYNTSAQKLEMIPDMIGQAIKSVAKARFDRAHFVRFEDSALAFDIVYYMESKEITDYLDAQQEINLKIKETFDKEKIEMAFPTQTIYLQK